MVRKDQHTADMDSATCTRHNTFSRAWQINTATEHQGSSTCIKPLSPCNPAVMHEYLAHVNQQSYLMLAHYVLQSARCEAQCRSKRRLIAYRMYGNGPVCGKPERWRTCKGSRPSQVSTYARQEVYFTKKSSTMLKMKLQNTPRRSRTCSMTAVARLVGPQQMHSRAI